MVLGKVRALGIYFDTLNENNLPVFSGGDLVSGRVVVDVAGDVRVKSLDIVARGVAKVRWTESRNGGAHTAYTQNYTEEVEYLHHYDTLIGEEREEECPDESVTVLHTGLHEFAFSFNLPQMALATSFEGKHGSVRYWVKAELHRPWLLPVRAKKEFIVFEHIDINTPLLLAPQAGTKEKTLCCWFCASGPISLSAKIERKGYTPVEWADLVSLFSKASPYKSSPRWRTAPPGWWCPKPPFTKTKPSSPRGRASRSSSWCPISGGTRCLRGGARAGRGKCLRSPRCPRPSSTVPSSKWSTRSWCTWTSPAA